MKFLTFSLVLVVCCYCVSAKIGTCEKGHPVLFIPGVFGSILNMQANIPESVPMHGHCKRQVPDHQFWIHVPDEIHYSCFEQYFRETYYPKLGKWVGVEGVNASVPRWGSTYCINTLDPSPLAKYAIPYFHNMIGDFEKAGYIDGVNMVAGGFVWFDPPTEEWVRRVMTLTENMVEKNGGVPALLVAHSMGAPYAYFFTSVAGEEWVKKYIYKIVYVGPAWAGATKALDIMFNGFDSYLPIAGRHFAPMARHFPTTWLLLPWKEAFNGEILAYTPSKNYTYDEIVDLLNAANATDVEGKFATSRGVFDRFNDFSVIPPVPIITYIGTNVKTMVALKFKRDIKPTDPDGEWNHDGRVMGEGDGTVPGPSLRYATEKWTAMGKKDITVRYVPKGEHLAMIRDHSIINEIINEAC